MLSLIALMGATGLLMFLLLGHAPLAQKYGYRYDAGIFFASSIFFTLFDGFRGVDGTIFLSILLTGCGFYILLMKPHQHSTVDQWIDNPIKEIVIAIAPVLLMVGIVLTCWLVPEALMPGAQLVFSALTGLLGGSLMARLFAEKIVSKLDESKIQHAKGKIADNEYVNTVSSLLTKKAQDVRRSTTVKGDATSREELSDKWFKEYDKEGSKFKDMNSPVFRSVAQANASNKSTAKENTVEALENEKVMSALLARAETVAHNK